MIVFAIAIVMGWGLTALVRQACFKWQVFDLPNTRSAHSDPTPTLGGVALVVGFWFLLVVYKLTGQVLPHFVYGLLAASVILCLLIRDEIHEMGWLQKLGIQVVAALVMVGLGLVLESVAWGHQTLVFGKWAGAVTVVFLVVLQNLYNFMDGLDGFASLEGVLIAGLWSGLFWVATPDLAYFLLGICGLTLGFWFWNKPPARIFLGDVGAHFLPLCFGMAVIVGQSQGGVSLGVVMLPLVAFLFDAVYTLVRRLLRRENITQAHRFHLYQRLQNFGWHPWAITGVYAVFTLLLGGCTLAWHFGLDAVGDSILMGTVFCMGMGIVWIERQSIMFERGER